MKIMQIYGPAGLATYALFSLAATAFAEGKPSMRDSASAKVEPEPPKLGEQAEHNALTRAHQSGMNQAQAAIRYIESNSTALDKLGRALDESQEHRQVLEKTVAEGSRAADAYQTMRDHEQSAAEHYRSFVLEVSKTKSDPDQLKDEAKSLADELKDAEAAHKKIFSPSADEDDTEPGTPSR
jgi:chromosome segregation ATPase